jgi:hypothetical protein
MDPVRNSFYIGCRHPSLVMGLPAAVTIANQQTIG